MPRSPREYRFDTRDARLKLKPRKEPYWRQVVPGTFLGLAKGARASSWIARQRRGSGYSSTRIGTPDDFAPADGTVVLSYGQAVRRATEIQVEARAPAPKHYGDGLTIDQVVAAYLSSRATTPGSRSGRVMGQQSAKITRQLWNRHSGQLGKMLVTAVDAKHMRSWHAELAMKAPTRRGKVMAFDPDDAVHVRRRRQSANRTLTILKAALQFARDSETLPNDLPDYWRRVKPFKIGDDPPPRMMEPDEIIRLLNAAEPDLRDLLFAALMTGARYGELTVLKVADYSQESQTVRIAQGKTGKVLQQPLTAEGAKFFARLVAGRGAAEFLLVRRDGQRWGQSHAARPMRAAAERAGVADITFKTTRATYGKLLLLATKDIELVAKALGHSDTRITRIHYAALLPGEVARGVALMPALGVGPAAKVRKIR